jgi:uncharacterized protein YheU (UPF0270 family)
LKNLVRLLIQREITDFWKWERNIEERARFLALAGEDGL